MGALDRELRPLALALLERPKNSRVRLTGRRQRLSGSSLERMSEADWDYVDAQAARMHERSLSARLGRSLSGRSWPM
jgi:hypothetical protein